MTSHGRLAVLLTCSLLGATSFVLAQTKSAQVVATDLDMATGETFEWAVQVFNETNECGGVMVRQGWVLTAAHCVAHRRKAEKHVWVFLPNEHDVLTPGGFAKVSWRNIHVHEKYGTIGNLIAPLRKFDIALLKLDKITNSHKDISIELGTVDDDKNLASAHVGVWRPSNPSVPNSPDGLFFTDVPVHPYDKCDCDVQGKHLSTKPLRDEHLQIDQFIWAGGEWTRFGQQQYDSGSGLTTGTGNCAKLVGISSQRGPWDRHMRVSKFEKEWIRKTMGDQKVTRPSAGICNVN